MEGLTTSEGEALRELNRAIRAGGHKCYCTYCRGDLTYLARFLEVSLPSLFPEPIERLAEPPRTNPAPLWALNGELKRFQKCLCSQCLRRASYQLSHLTSPRTLPPRRGV